MNLTVGDLLNIEHVGVQNLEALRAKSFSGVSTDSRSVKQGNLFFALRGEKFDGHIFVESAFVDGAVCAVVDERADQKAWQSKPVIIVNDTTQALGQLSRIYREKFDIPVIAVAGSNGKTTTKEMISAVLSTRYNVLTTSGNLNNHIGVPQTLFRLKAKHEIAVIEIGTNHFGEIMNLCKIVQPTHGVITNIGREHLEFFENLEGVAKAEGELFDSMEKSGVGFVNADDPLILMKSRRLKKKITYGLAKRTVTIHGTFLKLDEKGCMEFSVKAKSKKAFRVKLSVPGNHAVLNALAAAAVGVTMKVPAKKIQRALENFRAVGKRMEVIRAHGVTILNDTYNANPDSVISALETLRAMWCRGKKIVILADMLELGAGSREEHRRIGERIGTMGFEYLLTYGAMARYIHDAASVHMKFHYDQKNILSEYAAEILGKGDIALVKGSRGMKMEDVVTFLVDRLEKKAA